jgi:hypothetical protein
MSSKPRTSRQSKQPSTGVGREEGSEVNPAREREIRRRAYESYLEHGERARHDLEDWLQAERELASHEITYPGE